MRLYWIVILNALSLQFLSSQISEYHQLLKLIPDQAEEADFGTAVDIEGDWVMVSAEDASVNGISSGAVYVYNKNSGTPVFVKKLVPSDASNNNQFGDVLSIENTSMVVGARSKTAAIGGSFISNAGKIYIYEKDAGGNNNWGEIKAIQSPNPAEDEFFGYSVDIGVNVIAVGAYGNNDMGSQAGKVYLYGRNIGGADNWGFLKAITQIDGVANSEFGRWVEVSDDYLFVTSYENNSQGKVHVFYKNEGGLDNWGYKKTLVSDDPGNNQFFGDETSLDGDEILIGELRYVSSSSVSTGKSFLYQKDQGGNDNWGLVKEFSPTVVESDMEYGSSVDLNGDYIIIGAEEESSDNSSDAGAAYIYYRHQGSTNNWGLINKIFACDADPEDELGTSVAIDGGQAIIGADDDSGVINNAGAAYLFQTSTSPLQVDNPLITTTNNLQYHSGLAISSGAQINMSGKTVRYTSPESIELKNSFSISNNTAIECIIDTCN